MTVFSGLSHAIGKTIEGLIQLIQNPEQLLALVDLAKAIWNDWTVVGDMIAGAVGSVQEAQQRHNPFSDPGDTLGSLASGDFSAITDLNHPHTRFGVGWYTGYVAGFIVEAIVGSKGATKIKQVIRARSTFGEYALNAGARLRAATVGKATGYAKRSGLRVDRGLRDRTPELDATAVRRALSTSATTTKQRVASKLRDLDPSTRRVIGDNGLEARAVRSQRSIR
jgi:hypothetical protein